ncbi:GNAT family N-acetyltransferase [Cohnella lubricantis]|uniref:GNAT family N-acetyltransferase n=1 Tax=Cohnella lubricantis TaxID=2163172 RepID=A0A841TBU4_9BACL|nr:GNAT family N-acetyltransferase [Cohnella lubricantis]MBB6678943.1 GNAT family N-acetyltransferase [Cohnella lubricantis]MBP2118839.1 GNAT superfamily N-acetyltransferase [Cohnella lubricantis]
MEIRMWDRLDDRLWPEARQLYLDAFPEGKPVRIIENTFAKGVGLLFVALQDGETAAMALAGPLRQLNALLIDYIAVRPEHRRLGVGTALVEEIARYARSKGMDGLILEAEAGPEPENAERVRFWERCGFTLTPYVHQYIWVPEPYRAMYLTFDPARPLPTEGQELFKHIGGYHSFVFRR